MNAKVNIYETEWCNLVFQGKNQEYGAYEIRQHSSDQHAKAIFFTLSLVISCIIIIPFLSKTHKTYNDSDLKQGIIHLLPPPVNTPIEIPKAEKPQPPQMVKSSIRFTPPEITNNPVSDDFKSQEAILNDKIVIGPSDWTGNPEGINPDDLRIQITGGDPKSQIPDWVEQMPEFPGGTKALMEFLQNHIKYPSAAREGGISGRVCLKFVVNKDGEISSINLIRGIGGGCDEEAMRVVKMMPKWRPGKQNGNPVPVYYNLPIVFTLAE